MTIVDFQAPVTGWATSLADVPDPAFAQGFLGDGLAVDPFEGELRSPCDGVIVSLHHALHACTIRATNGAEILLHIGVDTVELKGEGFETFISEGQTVRAGDKLIAFDLDKVGSRARSLQVIMLVANGDEHTVASRVLNSEVAVGETVLSVESRENGSAQTVVASNDDRENASETVTLMIANGLHARPAAALANIARSFAGTVAVECRGTTADAKSIVALMALGTSLGDTLLISAQGAGAADIVNAIVAAVASGLGDQVLESAPALTAMSAKAPGVPLSEKAEDLTLLEGDREITLSKGTTAVSGIAVGPAVRLFHTTPKFEETGDGEAHEKQRFENALAKLSARLEEAAKGGTESAEIFKAHLALLHEPDLKSGSLELISKGKSAEFAWSATTSGVRSLISGLKDPRMVERAADLRDLELQLLGLLTGHDPHAVLDAFPQGGVLVTDEVLPSELTAVPPSSLAGICMVAGGKTSHAVILAESMNIPTLVAAGDDVARIPEGAPLILDGVSGSLRVFASEEDQVTARTAMAAKARQRELNRQTAHETCFTADGHRIEVFANLGKLEDAHKAMREGAEGCGLLRSEFLYLGRSTAPTEDEQYQQYQAIADALKGRPLIIRTLDAGGDKPLAYFPIAPEENPALGVRGVRATLQEQDLLRTQLRAILRVKPFGIARIMVPMITCVEELRAVKAMVEEERIALGRDEPVDVGTMIEVPAAALTTSQLAQEAAFFSIGTNDLTQYGLAMDRGNPALASRIDALHPGVLRLIEQVALGAASKNRTVAVCGGAASDLCAVPVLIGLGVTELSVTPAMIAEVKALIRTLKLPDCKAQAQLAVKTETSSDVRRLVSAVGM